LSIAAPALQPYRFSRAEYHAIAGSLDPGALLVIELGDSERNPRDNPPHAVKEPPAGCFRSVALEAGCLMKRPYRSLATAIAASTGLYVAQHMYRKSLRAQKGELDEPSVVDRPAARSLFGIPNATLGIAYYGLQLSALALEDLPAIRRGTLAASTLALAQSMYLMYSLLFVTRMPCPYCWTGHAVNVLLFALAVSAKPDSEGEG